MPGSNFSVVNGSDGVSRVAISTPANDANGNTVVGHLLMTAIGGVAIPVDAAHPLQVGVGALPLPPGAATDASLLAIAAALQTMQASLSAILAANASYQGAVPMTIDTAQAAQRAVRIACTVAGNVSLTFADGSTDVVPVNVGLSYIAGAITKVNGTGTTATATYANMK